MLKIVLAEDDPTMINLLTTVLKMDGFEVRAVDADEDVTAVVDQEVPNYLVLDVRLLNQNGLDVLDHIRHPYPAKYPYIKMISGLNMKEEYTRRGADDFQLKLFKPDGLLRLLQNNVKSN